MGRDYVQRESGGRQARPKPALPGWLWLLAGVAIGVAGAAIYYISRPTARVDAIATTDDAVKSNSRKKVELPPKETSRFTFYELLPKYEVVIPKETLKSKPATTSAPSATTEPASGERYLIQVGSFKSRGEAEGQRANLALLGIESRIESITIDNTETWYRVRIGPERGAQKIQSIMARLDENKIDALVLRVPE